MTNTKNNINGWIIIDKPKGISSAGVVAKLKHLLHPAKIGHAGTLDPLATGVLPIALGKATRLIPFVMDETKTYEFDVKWGIETDSDDLGGNETATCDKRPTKEEILAVLPKFSGPITQTPSPYSAIKVGGKRAYELARKGEEVKIPERSVTVQKLQLIENTEAGASFIAKVSKGTYIRTLAHDMAHALNTVGVVIRLHRIQDGPFTIQQAVSPEGKLTPFPIEEVLQNVPKLEVSRQIAERLSHGQRVKFSADQADEKTVAIWYNHHPIAIVQVKKNVLHPRCVLTDFCKTDANF